MTSPSARAGSHPPHRQLPAAPCVWLPTVVGTPRTGAQGWHATCTTREEAHIYQTQEETYMYQTKNDLPAQTRADVIEILNARLADSIDLMHQAKQEHWNVKSRHSHPPWPPTARACDGPSSRPTRSVTGIRPTFSPRSRGVSTSISGLLRHTSGSPHAGRPSHAHDGIPGACTGSWHICDCCPATPGTPSGKPRSPSAEVEHASFSSHSSHCGAAGSGIALVSGP